MKFHSLALAALVSLTWFAPARADVPPADVQGELDAAPGPDTTTPGTVVETSTKPGKKDDEGCTSGPLGLSAGLLGLAGLALTRRRSRAR